MTRNERLEWWRNLVFWKSSASTQMFERSLFGENQKVHIMKAAVHLILFGFLVVGLVNGQVDRHKSEAQIRQMTPDQRVQEYCDEYYHHAFWHDDYIDMLNKYIFEDGIKALPSLTQIIDEFDPASPQGRGEERDARAFAAEGLLSQVDGRVVRLRGLSEGRPAIDALTRLVQRMLAAHFDTADVTKAEHSDRYRYQATREEAAELKGLNIFDHNLQDTFRIRYKIILTDKQMLDFVNYLISRDPRYPTWSTMEDYKDMRHRNAAGNPRQYALLQNAQPFYDAYRKFRSAR